MNFNDVAAVGIGAMQGVEKGINLQNAQTQQAVQNVDAQQKMQSVAKYNKPIEINKYISGLPEEHRDFVKGQIKDLAVEGGDPNNPIAKAGEVEEKLKDFTKLTTAYTMTESAKKFLLPRIQQTKQELEPLMKQAQEYSQGVKAEKAQIEANPDLLPNQKLEALAKVDARVAKFKEEKKTDIEKLQKLSQQYQTDTNKFNHYVLQADGMDKSVEKAMEMGVPKNLFIMASEQPQNPDGSLTPEQQQVHDIMKDYKKKEKLASMKNTAFIDKKGKTVILDMNDPVDQARITAEGLKTDTANNVSIRVEPQTQKVNQTTGAVYDTRKKQWTMPQGEGKPSLVLSGEQARQLGLQTKEETTVNDIKVMQQSAPSVLYLTKQVNNQIKAAEKGLGPFGSRWKEIEQGKIGMEDPMFSGLKTTAGLLESRLMKMHVGSRGSDYIMEHFHSMLDVTKQSPKNLLKNIQVINDYAEEVKGAQIPKLYKDAIGESDSGDKGKKTQESKVELPTGFKAGW